MQVQDHHEFPEFDHRAAPPAKRSSIGDGAMPGLPRAHPGNIRLHENWRIFKRHFWGECTRHSQRRIKEARFPAVKSLDSFDFAAIPSLNKTLVLELARSEYVTRRENIIAVGNSGTGKTHIGLGLGLAACQKGLSVGFYTA
ncbi:MAG TPA: ATP-binding protein, partial [Terriglobales bacterium]